MKSLSKAVRQRLTPFLGLSLFISLPCLALPYEFRLLTAPQAIATSAQAINNNGEVAGQATFITYRTFSSGVHWSDEGSVLGYQFEIVTDVNDAGVLVGNVQDGYLRRSAMTDNRTIWSYLPSLIEGGETAVYAINDLNQATGYAISQSGRHAVRWDGAVVTDLGTLGGRFSIAHDISNAGTVVGASRPSMNSCCNDHATLWIGKVMIDLGNQLGYESHSIARSINEHGAVVGYANMPNGRWGAVKWTDGAASWLPALDGFSDAVALSINERGQSVGSAFGNQPGRAVLWDGDIPIDLTTLMPAHLLADGWLFESATGINDQGTVVGTAINYRLGQQAGWVLEGSAEVPEPSTASLMMLLLGCCAVALSMHRANGFSVCTPPTRAN